MDGFAAHISARAKRLSRTLVTRRHGLLTAALWSAIAGVILLPAFSQTGYPVWSQEYMLTALAGITAGLLCQLAARVRRVGALLLITLMTFSSLLYFGGAILNSDFLLLMTALAFPAFVFLALFRFRITLRICGLAAATQIAATALAVPEADILVTEKRTLQREVPSVIHILLDEHAGIAAFPESAVDREHVERLEAMYLSQGFTVFRRAYSADKRTELTLARLFNDAPVKPPLNSRAKTISYLMPKARALKQISRTRALDLTFTTRVDFRPAAAKLANVVRLRMVAANKGGTTPGIENLSVAGRFWIAAAMLRSWLINKADSPLAKMFFGATETGQAWTRRLRPAAHTSPLVGRAILQEVEDHMACCLGRGTYLFAHAIHPHQPFLFDRNCNVLPPSAWLVTRRLEAPHTEETWRERWRRHYEQALCAARDVGRLVDTVNKQAALADATIIVHGDHGSRIGMENYTEAHLDGYDEAAFERDFRGTFFAVRIPGVLEGRIIETPVRIDDLFRHLLERDFRGLDPGALRPRPDSPYPWTGARAGNGGP